MRDNYRPEKLKIDIFFGERYKRETHTGGV